MTSTLNNSMEIMQDSLAALNAQAVQFEKYIEKLESGGILSNDPRLILRNYHTLRGEFEFIKGMLKSTLSFTERVNQGFDMLARSVRDAADAGKEPS